MYFYLITLLWRNAVKKIIYHAVCLLPLLVVGAGCDRFSATERAEIEKFRKTYGNDVHEMIDFGHYATTQLHLAANMKLKNRLIPISKRRYHYIIQGK